MVFEGNFDMEHYLDFLTTGDLEKDTKEYFLKYGKIDTYQHTLDVINELNYIEKQFGHVESGSSVACYCHDLGRVVKSEEIIDFCIENNIEVSNEERRLPGILHQKISCLLAEKVFGINNKMILNAIRYHTTSRKNPSIIEIEVFLSDKMSWNDEGYRELAKAVKEALKHSKEGAMFYYLRNMYENREKLRVYHIDSIEAFEFFKENYNIS